MRNTRREADTGEARKRLTKEQRRRRFLQVALLIVRDEGADRLTLGYLAERAGVSKPVAYDHFETRSGLLIALYRWIDVERVSAFRDACAASEQGRAATLKSLASAYITCAADTTDEFHKVGAALAGSEEKSAVFQELLDNAVQMFVSVLAPHSKLPKRELERRCVGLVGAGEALSAALIRGSVRESDAISSFRSLIDGALRT